MEASKTDWINFFQKPEYKRLQFLYRNLLHFPKDHFFNFAGTHICNFFHYSLFFRKVSIKNLTSKAFKGKLFPRIKDNSPPIREEILKLMNEPHLTYPLAKPADGYVKLIHGSVDIKVIDAVFDPTHSITAHPEPLEHVGGQGYRVDPVGGDVRHLAGDPVGMGVDPLGEYAGHGNYFPGAQNVIANSQRVGFHSHKQNEIKQQKL